MTTAAITQNLNRIHGLAAKLANSMVPFFFVRNSISQESLQHANLTLKINRQMTPFLNSLPANVRLGFWSSSQFEQLRLPAKILENSMVVNPFKTEKLVFSALSKGVKRMLVSDLEQIEKIQNLYYNSKRKGVEIAQPEYFWRIEDCETDAKSISSIQSCELTLHGIYFSEAIRKCEIEQFLGNRRIKLEGITRIREIAMENLQGQSQRLRQLGLEPMVNNFSETDRYTLICRVLGRDQLGKPVFDHSCLDFICRGNVCRCGSPTPQINSMFTAGGYEWAAIQPARLDKLKAEFIHD